MNQDKLIYKHEGILAAITLILGIAIWLALIVGTLGVALIYVLFGFLFYCFAQSGFIAWIKGTAVKLSPTQHPDLYRHFEACCRQLGMESLPDLYLTEANGVLNAFATRFFGRNFVVLYAAIVDALADDEEAIRFYLGHELGHIRQGHLTGHVWRLPALWIPLLGAAYDRAKEYTCDLHGRACCPNAESAARALTVLAAGQQRWKNTNLADFAKQAQDNAGFWGSFHELTSAYPWLCKRVARVQDPDARPPQRNPLAYLLALFVPNGGRLGGVGGIFLFVLVLGILAATALPAYKDYQRRMIYTHAWNESVAIRQALSDYYLAHDVTPDSLATAQLPDTLADGSVLTLDSDTMTLSVETRIGAFVMTPSLTDDGKIVWGCKTRPPSPARQLPESCRSPGAGH